VTTKTFTILNVEDLPNNRDLVRRILESQGYRVVDAVNGLEGIAKATELRPDLILMDINLPDLDGFSVVTKIRSHPQLARIPIIALTARNVTDDAARAAAIGCDSYISKPFGVKELQDEVQKFVGKQHGEETVTQREFYLREQSVVLVEELERKFAQLKEAHEELSAMHERLQRLDQAKTDFISIASHELRTPLTMVHAYTDMLRTNPKFKDDANLQEMLGGLRKGVDRLGDIINDMISIVRVELSTLDLAYTPLSLRTVVAPVIKEVMSAIEERNLTLEVRVPDSLPQVVGDDTQLHQVFSRLIGNAIKYTPDEGKISVSARVHQGNGSAPLRSGDQGEAGTDQFLEVVIADTGIGINKEDQNHIFEKFFTVEDVSLHSSGKTQFRGGGPGLGLTIVKGIVEAHGGRIWVESEGYDPKRNPGSTFYVLLPAYQNS
jgi:signal transduction histidine kinase